VETAAQLDHVRGANCDAAQGYLMSHPMPVPDAEQYLTAERMDVPA
jgi:EAL domain-containing protein (putative c-di-GMP-specific phosphodiesterase class I)